VREIAPATGPLIAAKDPWPEGADAAGPLLAVCNVSKTFRIRKAGLGPGADSLLAVDDVSFDVRRGECLGLVGESGCGKTTLSKIIMRAITPSQGEVIFNERGRLVDVLALKGEDLLRFRRRIQFIFQDPYGSLNPRMTVFEIITEPLLIHGISDSAGRAEFAKELMRLVGLDIRHLKRYPHSFSGGQRQRIGIARALALSPDLVICDEPVSALDVSVQAQILNLLKDLQKELGLTYLFISHNLAVVDYMADRIAVMCRGRIVELAPRETLLRKPIHPYTQSLLAAVPFPDLDRPLDFQTLQAGGASDSNAWGPQFRDDGEADALSEADLGGGHLVLARRSVDARELRP
jgi:peptide/nickel transport system ATP-binding protein